VLRSLRHRDSARTAFSTGDELRKEAQYARVLRRLERDGQPAVVRTRLPGDDVEFQRSRPHFTIEQKVAILRRHMVDKVPVSDLCDELELQPKVLASCHLPCEASNSSVVRL
jgi:hypothetical protein